jgi:hypothetical protein
LVGAMALPPSGAPIGHEPDRIDWGPVDFDLEVEVQSGAGAGGAFDADPLSDPDTGTRDRLYQARANDPQQHIIGAAPR